VVLGVTHLTNGRNTRLRRLARPTPRISEAREPPAGEWQAAASGHDLMAVEPNAPGLWSETRSGQGSRLT